MKKNSVGAFEEIVLLVTANLDGDAYGVTITMEIEKQTGREPGFNTVHTTLQRLEEKGLVTSQMDGATAERGGRRKRYFSITPLGCRVLRDVKETRDALWATVPKKILKLAGN
ncbi:MAG TPA: PadR family transcriptional regulator [Cyclobacteriaceae bacterium]|jgi:DNA-binding PadR family transcriptional regulator|nr:PadR family transcriptional regulator [Cyclobacteriaceae bacterium]